MVSHKSHISLWLVCATGDYFLNYSDYSKSFESNHRNYYSKHCILVKRDFGWREKGILPVYLFTFDFFCVDTMN